MINDSSIPYIMEGMVVDVDDPDQMGKVKIWIPSLDGENYNIEDLPWADYASPFAGFTVDYPAGNNSSVNESHAAYGFWALPKIGATVLVFFLYGDPTNRYYFASTIRLHRNRSLPAGRNFDNNGNPGPFGDAENDNGELIAIQPAYNNLREQFQNKLTQSESKTRGAYERQVAQGKFNKDGTEGYSANPADNTYLDSQTYCFVTPGRHALIFQDDPHFSRLRVKTAEGHQIILDDSNERIYVSTSKGKTWIEMDEDGHINIFGGDSISIRSGKDINMYADGNINMEADKAINIKSNNQDVKILSGAALHLHSTTTTNISACGNLDLRSNSTMKIAASAAMHIKAFSSLNLTGLSGVNIKSDSNILQTGSQIHLNGPAAVNADEADCATSATSPTIVPGHEPWTRPTSSKKRNANWKA